MLPPALCCIDFVTLHLLTALYPIPHHTPYLTIPHTSPYPIPHPDPDPNPYPHHVPHPTTHRLKAPQWVDGYHDIIFDAMCKMEGAELRPNEKIYNCIIYAFARGGDAVAAEYYFWEMKRKGKQALGRSCVLSIDR